MRLPSARWSLRWMLIAVAVVAVNFGMVRWASDLEELYSLDGIFEAACLLGAPVSLLAVAAGNIATGLWRRGKAPAFSSGYFIAGGITSFAVCFLLVSPLLLLLLALVSPGLALEWMGWADGSLGFILVVGILVALQIGFALIGGALAARLRLRLVLVPDDEEATEAHH